MGRYRGPGESAPGTPRRHRNRLPGGELHDLADPLSGLGLDDRIWRVPLSMEQRKHVEPVGLQLLGIVAVGIFTFVASGILWFVLAAVTVTLLGLGFAALLAGCWLVLWLLQAVLPI